jgi:hypothetical protein
MAAKKPAPKSAKKAAPKSAKKAAPKMCPDCGKPIVNGKCACDTGMAKGKGGW